MKISVIVPVYNVKTYLNRCVDSILNQTFENFELILVDDGSTDGSELICDKYLEVDARVKVIHKVNGGLSDARNSGIDIAKGDWYTFIDSDDWVEKNYLEILYKNADKYDVDISIVNHCRVYSDDSKGNSTLVDEGVHTGIETLQDLYTKNATYTNIACGKLYKSTLFSDLRFPYGKLYEDAFVAHKLIYKSQKIFFSNECLYYYYQRTDSITKTFNINRMDEYELYIERRNFFEEKGLENLYILNEKARLTAIKSLIKNMYKNRKNIDKADMNHWVSVFKKDIKKDLKPYVNDGLKNKITNFILIHSPYVYYIFYAWRNAYQKRK